MITLTDSATDKVRQLIDQANEDGLALRVTARPAGCSGFNYDLFFDTDIAEDDITLDQGGVRVVADTNSAQLLEGARLDYGGDEAPGFSIMNPNSAGSCGCGHG